MKDKIRKIIKENYDRNRNTIPWNGMHERAVKKIMKIIEKKA